MQHSIDALQCIMAYKHYKLFKDIWKDKPGKPLKRGYKRCRRNRNLKRGYCCE